MNENLYQALAKSLKVTLVAMQILFLGHESLAINSLAL